MYIVNEHGILHGIPDSWAIPAKARKATEHEIGVFRTTKQRNTALMPVAQGTTQPPTMPTVTAVKASKGKGKRK